MGSKAEAFPMKGGDGLYSYTKNSQYQRAASDVAKGMIEEAIADKFDIKSLSSTSDNTIRIADLGCSVGPNTFFAMQNVLKAMENKFHSSTQDPTSEIPEFQLFFDDHVSNDFNTLFSSLPPDRHYFAAGVPGSFHARLFPKSSLQFVHSSYALQWLSKVPEELVDKSSPAWNKRRIHYSNAPREVGDAYSAQFGKDMRIFLNARADEIVVGGLMILIMPAISDGLDHSQLPSGILFGFLEKSLNDMVKMGSISETELDSLNIPVYSVSPKEMAELVERNGRFSIERMELTSPRSKLDGPISVASLINHLRAGFEGLLSTHFGFEIIDQLFDRTVERSAEISSALESSSIEGTQLFLILKRK